MVKYNPIDEMGEMRKNLLNLTLKNNNLLNYKVSPKRTLQVAGMSPEALYDALVIGDKKLKISIKKETDVNVINMTDTAETLEQKLIYINRQANSIREEQGYSVLYLAVGFLQWKDAESGKTPISPILLIPVEIIRTGRTKVFSIKWTGEEVFTSMTLQMKMHEKNIGIPDFTATEGKEAIKEYFKTIKDEISSEKEWKVTNDIRLDLFDFKKFVMYKDIDPALWSHAEIETNYPLIAKVFGIDTDKYKVRGFNPADIDATTAYNTSYNVVDADSSQIAVIESIKDLVDSHGNTLKQGLDMVVIGPPGTGKSQTIVNTIAECIAQKKSVLFVCEKMAAIKVVKGRLDRIGLGDLCLELHSDTKKRVVLDSIAKSLYSEEVIKTRSFLPTELLNAKKPLNEYARALREPIGLIYPNFYTLYGIREDIRLSFCDKNINDIPTYVLRDPETWNMNDWTEAKNAIAMLTQWAKLMPVRERVWYGCEPATILPSDLKGINSMVLDVTSRIDYLDSALDEFAEVMEVNKPTTLTDIEKLIEVARKPLNKSNECCDIELKIGSMFKDEIFDMDFSEFELLSNKLFKLLDGKYKMMKKNILACYRTTKPTKDDEIVNDLKLVQQCKKMRKEVETFRKTDDKKRLREVQAMNGVTDREKQFGVAFSKLNNVLNINFNLMFGVELEDVELNVLSGLMRKWNSELENDNDGFKSVSLITWSQYLAYRKTFMATKAEYLIPDFENGKLYGIDMNDLFEWNYVETLINKNIRAKPELSKFTKIAQDGNITTFKKLDTSLITENSKRVMLIALNEMKKARVDPENRIARAVLETEFNKKRNIPIRKLMRESGSFIQKIKPCFMMSPITVAQYLDPKAISFDVIIFDEASQIRPEDAIGTLLRGKQLIVMGDPKQLPPTSFFDSVIDDEDFDESDTAEMESILNLCKRNFITKNLSWHYRSRHESLIAVSNNEFYGNDLQVYPSPSQKNDALGLKFEYHPETVYDRGTTGVNREEARIVAEAVFTHYKTYPEKSLGVGTFNIKQQIAIQEEIDKLKQKNSKIKIPEDGEYFFVKNLETIQGDERDVIFLSIGFGFDTQKKFSMNFGALNKEGGERRLNVLITRAREKCVIFSNFRAQDLKPEGLTSVGLKCLRAFLEFAESRELEEYTDTSDETRTFEDSVYLYLKNKTSLEKNGYKVHRNVGCSGYKMDIAITDPTDDGKYIMGITCDGEKYFTSMVCRDRDRLREDVLKGLGWSLCRVWATEWYLNPRKARNALFDQIKDVINEHTATTKTQPEPQEVGIKA